jgi:DNA-binding transcriptional regulator YiaG
VPRLESAIKEAIARGARRQIRLMVQPLRREVHRLRKKLTENDTVLASLRRSAAGWERMVEAGPPVPPVSEEDSKNARLSPRLIQSLRKRLRLSQIALARLVGVSAPAVAHWEAGNSAPRGQNRATLVGLRKIGRREVKALLARLTTKAPARKRPRKGPRRRKAGNAGR